MGPEQAGSEDRTASPMHRAATAGQEKIGLQIAPHIRLTEHGARERTSTRTPSSRITPSAARRAVIFAPSRRP